MVLGNRSDRTGLEWEEKWKWQDVTKTGVGKMVVIMMERVLEPREMAGMDRM